MKEFIDHTVFMGMHSIEDNTRIACKNFFIERLNSKNPIYFSLEQVGKCDDVIWSNFSNEIQAEYYPFMDHLHTLMNIKRLAYSQEEFLVALKNKNLSGLSLIDKMVVSQVISNKGVLRTTNQRLLNKKNIPVKNLKSGKELEFPIKLEKLYQKSLSLRLYSKGIIPPLITPINSQGNVDEKSVKNLINSVREYSSALMPTLSSGEGWALSSKQFSDMIRFTIKYSDDLPIYAGVEFKSTSDVIKYGLLAKDLGVDAIVITTPFQKNISQETIYQHFRSIWKKIKLPIFIYNEKAISGNEISFNTILKICKLGNIIGIKEASNNPDFTNKLIKKSSVPIFQGWEHLCFKSKDVDGYILPLCNLEPKFCSEMLKNPTKKMQNKINQLCERYNLVGDDWYVYLKKELKRRKIIVTDRAVK